MRTPDRFLRLVLQLDAVVTGANGVAYLAIPSTLQSLLGLPETSQRYAGLFLVVYAAAVLFASLQREVSRSAAGVFAGMNLLWALGSFFVLLVGALPVTFWGGVWLVLQALVVAGFAALQWIGLRR